MLLLCAWTMPAGGASYVNSPVCTAPGDQAYVLMVSDGAGGSFAVWRDERVGANLYAQHIDASGSPLWAANGVPVCTDTGARVPEVIVTDGAGGIIIVWQDWFGGLHFPTIHAQRLNGMGNPMWAANGVAVAAAGGYPQNSPAAISATPGGVILVWSQHYGKVYAQRISNMGTLLWGTSGIPISGGPQYNSEPKIVSDGLGGAIIAWDDARAEDGIYAQRLNSQGTALWAANGVPICTAGRPSPRIAPDSTGGAVIAWLDFRNVQGSIYAQRVNATGGIEWTDQGVPVCTVPGDKWHPEIIGSGAGGAILCWLDDRNPQVRSIYAQRLTNVGGAVWTDQGLPVVVADSPHIPDPRLIGDGADGAIIAWEDNRCGHDVVFAQRLHPSGVALWRPSGVELGTSYHDSFQPLSLVTDGAAGALVAWHNRRLSDGEYESDLYAQRIGSEGRLLPRAPSGFSPVQKVNVTWTSGLGYQELWYNYSSGESSITPYTAASMPVSYNLPLCQQIGVYHYDYTEARFSHAVYQATY